MSETTPLPKPEQISQRQIFEHLFPGNSWDRLPAFNPLNAIPLMESMVLHDSSVDYDFGQACEGSKGFAHRIDVSRPDKLTFAYRLLESAPVNDRPNRGWIDDLLHEGERLGGVAARDVSWLKASASTNTATFVSAALDKNTDMYNHGTGMLIGVLDNKGKPKAMILFRKGERPRQGIREQSKAWVGQASPVPVGIGI